MADDDLGDFFSEINQIEDVIEPVPVVPAINDKRNVSFSSSVSSHFVATTTVSDLKPTSAASVYKSGPQGTSQGGLQVSSKPFDEAEQSNQG
jgi:hypothetical protein